MTQTYRTTDLTRWGVGKGVDLDPDEADINFWDIIQRLLTLEALPDAAAGIDHFEVSGTTFYVHMTDATILGPYALPVATFADKGAWAAVTVYAVLDTFTINGGLYVVLFPHTSGLTFDAGANDGLGHDYYRLMVQTPGSSLPPGGAVGQVLQKSTVVDFTSTWGWKTPLGGTARQYHIKISSTQDDSEWDTPTAADIEFVPVTGSALTATNVADVIEEINSRTVSMANITDVLFATGDPTSGEFMRFNGAHWTAEALSVSDRRDDTVTALGTTGTVSLDPSLGDVFTITPTGAVALNAASAPAGAEITVIVTTSGTSSYNITPGTNFKSTGALATGVSTAKTFTMKFVGDGTNLCEVSRTVAM